MPTSFNSKKVEPEKYAPGADQSSGITLASCSNDPSNIHGPGAGGGKADAAPVTFAVSPEKKKKRNSNDDDDARSMGSGSGPSEGSRGRGRDNDQSSQGSGSRRQDGSVMSGSRRLGDIFFDRDQIADKPVHIKIKYYATAIAKLIWYILKYRFNDFLLTVESLACMWSMLVVPYQIAYRDQVEMDALWLTNYFVDSIQVVCAFIRMRAVLPPSARDILDRTMCSCCPACVQPASMKQETAKQRREKRRNNLDNDDDDDVCNMKAFKRVIPYIIRLLLFVPVDIVLWSTDMVEQIKFVRTLRLIPCPPQLVRHMEKIERSQAISFVMARSIRLIVIFLLVLHWVTCAFRFVSQIEDAEHFNQAPWYSQEDPNGTGEQEWVLYLYAMYWAMMTITQVGHKDVVNNDGEVNGGKVWEFVVATVVVVASSFLYIYIDANFTSMMLRFYGEVETYRNRIGAIDGYLKRNRVDTRLRVLVKQHFKETYQSEGKDDDTLLKQMPRSLRREVLKHINMRVLRKVAIFFGCDKAFMGQLCHALTRVTFIPSEEICKQGDIGRELYFLEHGRVQSTIEPPEDENIDYDEMEDWEIELRERDRVAKTVVRVLRDSGASLCSLAFLFGLRQEASLKAVKKTTCLMLPRDEYVAIATEFPGDTFKVREKCLVQAKELYGDAVHGLAVTKEVEAILAKKGNALFELMVAAAAGDEEQVRMLLNSTSTANTVGVNDYDYEGRTALHLAANKGLLGMSQLLVELNAQPTAKDNDQRTPLQAAVLKGHYDVAKLLRSSGATLGWDEFTASGELCEAAKRGNLEKLDVMLQCGAQINAADYDRRTCLHLAASTGANKVVEFLLKRGANVKAADRWGGTPLRDAVREGHLDVANHLRNAGGELGYDELTAAGELCEVAKRGDVESIKMLAKCGVQLDSADYDSRTAVHLAASEGNLHVIDILIAEGANVNCRDRWDGTPLTDALRNGHLEVAKKLIEAGGIVAYDDLTASGELCEFARTGKLERIQGLLDGGCNVDACDYDLRTCLHLAASVGNMLVIDTLQKAGANLSVRDRWGNTPLSEAIREGHLEVARYLIKHEAELGLSEEDSAGMLCDLARGGDVEKIKTLCSGGVDPSACDYDRRTALHLAACVGNVLVVEQLTAYGADVNFEDRWGNTALSEAVREGHKKVAEVLFEKGAELHFSENQAAGELCEFARNGDLERIKMLAGSGCDINAVDYDGRSCLHLAASLGNKLICAALLEAGSDMNKVDRWGGTPLADAVREGHRDIANKLIEMGAIIGMDESTASGELCELARGGDVDKVKLLLVGGCDANAADYDKRTCLHLAACVGNLHVCQLLLEHKADINFQDRWGGTALADALREGHTKLSNYLREQGGELKLNAMEAIHQLCEMTIAGDIDRVRQLLQGSCDPNACDDNKRTCLHLASSLGNTKVVEVLIEYGANVNQKDRSGRPPLADAINSGHRELALLIINHDGRLDYDEATASGELCEMARLGDLEKIRLLLQGGCDPNAADYDKRTCLHLAASEGNLTVAETLCAHEATDLNVKDRWDGTPLGDAVREGHDKVARLLHARGAQMAYEPEITSLRLSELARLGKLERMMTLVSFGCDVNAVDYDMRTCLHAAAGEGNVHVLSYLIEQGADVNAVDHRGCTPLDEAIRSSHQLVAQRLREAHAQLGQVMLPIELGRLARGGRLEGLEHLAQHGCNMDAADEDGRTCLHLASAYGHKHIVEFLANMPPDAATGKPRADLHAVDLQGRTALVYAHQQNHQHVVRYLQEVMDAPHAERAKYNTYNTFKSAGRSAEVDAAPHAYVDDGTDRVSSRNLLGLPSERTRETASHNVSNLAQGQALVSGIVPGAGLVTQVSSGSLVTPPRNPAVASKLPPGGKLPPVGSPQDAAAKMNAAFGLVSDSPGKAPNGDGGLNGSHNGKGLNGDHNGGLNGTHNGNGHDQHHLPPTIAEEEDDAIAMFKAREPTDEELFGI